MPLNSEVTIAQGKRDIARAMLRLHELKFQVSSSGRKQLAEIVVSLAELRERLDKVE